MTRSTDFESLSLLAGKSMQARIEEGEMRVTLPEGVCSFIEGNFSVGILRIRESDVEQSEIVPALVDGGNAELDAATGVSTATINLPNGVKISLFHV